MVERQVLALEMLGFESHRPIYLRTSSCLSRSEWLCLRSVSEPMSMSQKALKHALRGGIGQMAGFSARPNLNPRGTILSQKSGNA